MSWTKRNTCRCDECDKFCRPFDEATYFGAQGIDMNEPLDPVHCCKSCFPIWLKEWRDHFNKGLLSGDWQKSTAEKQAALEFGLVWINSGGIGVIGTRYFVDSHRYVRRSVYDTLSKLPYYGWCMTCGAERRGSYCSNILCEESFDRKRLHI